MSVISENGEPSNDVIYVNFNQTSRGLSVGTKTGYKLYKLDDNDKFELDFQFELGEEVHIIERHYLSSLIAFVKTTSPRKVFVYNFSSSIKIAEKQYANTILTVRVNRENFVVCLEDAIHIYDMTAINLKTMLMVSNPYGVIALNYNTGETLIAHPGKMAGEILIYSPSTVGTAITIPAHSSPLACLAFNDDSTKIASASKKGTVIKVFDSIRGTLLFEFRRGRREVSIYSLNFSSGSVYLSASSNTETVHVFKCVKEEDDVQSEIVDENEGWMATVTKVVSYSARYLPSQISDVFCQQRSFSTIHMPFYGVKNSCSVYRSRRSYYVFVVSVDGIVYTYSLNQEDGTCTLIRQHRLDQNSPVSEERASRPRPDSATAGSPTLNSTSARMSEKENCDSDGETIDCPPLSFSVT